MDIFLSGFLLFSSLFIEENREFFDQAIKEMKQGAEWHYVGQQELDPTAKSIPGRICDDDGCSAPYILWKLKMPIHSLQEERANDR
jgi:hypothetical protein